MIITGKASQTCPYFASREAISQAEVRPYAFIAGAQVTRRSVLQLVTLPYNLLLHREAREALGIDLTNQVVVIDEAHSKCFTMTPPTEVLTSSQDLISSLLALSTVTLPLGTLNVCLEQLTAYISRFKNRLASKHVLHLKRLYRLLHTLKGLLSNWQQHNSTAVMTVDGLLSKLGGKLEEINFLEIQNYLRKSKVWRNPSFVPPGNT